MVVRYIFKVINSQDDTGYVIYTEKENRLVCLLKNFENMHELEIQDLKKLEQYLKSKRTTEAISFHPQLEVVCSHFYEEYVEEGRPCEHYHFQIDDSEAYILNKKGIKVDLLNLKEEQSINQRLNFYKE